MFPREVFVSTSRTVEQPVDRIVVGVDGSPSSEQALRWAADQSRLTGQALHAVIAWHAPVPYDSPVTSEFDWSRDAAGVLSKTVENFLGEHAALSVVQDVQPGHPAQVLIDASRDAGLLVVGSRGHGGFGGLLLGSVSQHVVAHAACPVVVAHDHRSGTGPIVVGVDGSPESAGALRWAAQQARLTRRELRAVNAWHVPVSYGVTVGVERDWAADSHHALATAVTRDLGEQDAADVVREIVEDYPAAALLRAAEGADLLVVGCRGRGAFPGMLLGSVSRHVAAHASCPVLVYHGSSASPATT
jgi:nucleotide-binding universal stress UspA family protein